LSVFETEAAFTDVLQHLLLSITGIKGHRKSKKDKLREAAAKAAESKNN